MATDNEKINALSEQQTEKLLGKELFRKRVNEIICDYVEKVDFSNLVKKYAAEEMDQRVFRSGKYWLTVISTSLIASLIGAAIGIYVK